MVSVSTAAETVSLFLFATLLLLFCSLTLLLLSHFSLVHCISV